MVGGQGSVLNGHDECRPPSTYHLLPSTQHLTPLARRAAGRYRLSAACQLIHAAGRDPGDYALEVYLFRELIAEKGFVLHAADGSGPDPAAARRSRDDSGI